MKKLYLTFFFFLFFNYINGQNSSNIIIGKTDHINSKILNENREIWIHVPKGYSNKFNKNKKYPVLYLLDGNSHFHSVVGMVKQLSSLNGNTICPKMIIVGIPNTNRTRDLTPTKAKAKPGFLTDYMATNSGGGNKFISFIEKELIPYIDSKYSTESYRTFVGHSLGGLTIMNTLIHKPELFNSYVAIDPSMWWNNRSLLNKIKNIKFDKKYSNRSLFLGIANTMNKSMDTIRVKKDTTYATRHIRAILELKSILNKDTLNNLSFKAKYYEKETHGSVPLITEYDAFHYIFDFYQLKIDKGELINPKSDILNKIKNYYIRLSKEYGRNIKPQLTFVENKGYELMRLKQFKRAEQLFKLNITNYPENFNVYNSLGDLYVTIKNKEKAIEVFKKSMLLDKDPYSKSELMRLQKKK